MFRALTCPSLGWKILFTQHLVSWLSVNVCTVHRLRADCSVVCCQVEVSATDWSLVQRSPADCGASLCVIKKPHTRGGYSPARGLQNTNPQWVVAPVEKKWYSYQSFFMVAEHRTKRYNTYHLCDDVLLCDLSTLGLLSVFFFSICFSQ